MLNWLILYGLLFGFWLRLYHHGRVVVPGNEAAGLAGFAKFWLRSWVFCLVIVIGLRSGIPGVGYVTWWSSYSTEHSMILWLLTTVPLTIGLWGVKEITFRVMAKPWKFGFFAKGAPSLHEISMGVPTVWNALFWTWLLLSPTLPFRTCFLRIFLGGASPPTVIPFN